MFFAKAAPFAALSLGLFILAAQPAAAQTATEDKAATTSGKGDALPAAAPKSAGLTDITTAAFGDWSLRCGQTPASESAPSRKICEIIQAISVKGQSQPLAQLSIGRVNADQPLLFTAVVPTNISLPGTVKIATSKEDAKPLELAFTRCVPPGCFANATLTDEALKKLRAQSAAGYVGFKLANAQELRIAMSFNGLARALEALGKQ